MEPKVSLSLSILVVLLLVFVSSKKSEHGFSWMYNVTKEPVFSLVYLVVLIVIASNETFFPVAVLLMVIYLMHSTTPVMSRVSEHFMLGPPVANCDIYDEKKISEYGTPFYPLNAKHGSF